MSLFLSSFWLTSFIFLSQRGNIFCRAPKILFAFLLSNWFSHVSFTSRYTCSTRMEILVYLVSIKKTFPKVNSWKLTHCAIHESLCVQHTTVMFVYILLRSYWILIWHIWNANLTPREGRNSKFHSSRAGSLFLTSSPALPVLGSLSPLTMIPYTNKWACLQATTSPLSSPTTSTSGMYLSISGPCDMNIYWMYHSMTR